MRAIVLGAAAGGGLPQWNCGCANCNSARSGTIPAQTQSSLAVSADGETWVLLNASPDLRAQMLATPALHPQALRHTPVAGVVLTNGDIDHVAGLLTLREKQAFDVFATPAILRIVADNPVFGALDRTLVRFHEIALDRSFQLAASMNAELFAVPGKVPLYMEQGEVATDLMGEQTVGVELAGNGRRMLYIPGCARMTEALAARIDGADAVFFDGTLYEDDEMLATGTGAKTGRRMGHMPMSGEGGSLVAFEQIDVGRRIYIHMNNTNPVWQPDSPARRAVETAGWTVGHDGLEVML